MRFEAQFLNENLQDYPLMVRVWIAGSKLGHEVLNSVSIGLYL
jgi:hypothetical protein